MNSLADHVVPWLCILVKERLMFGPFINQRLDMLQLIHGHGVTHIVNMCPLTEEVTEKTKLNKATWYTQFFENLQDAEPTLVRLPIPNDLSTYNETKQIEFYIQTAKHVCDLWKDPRNVVYVHNKTGFDEEAMVSLLAWQMFDKAFPKDVCKWLRENMYERVLDDEDKKALLAKALEKSISRKSTMLDAWVTVKKAKVNGGDSKGK